VLRRYRRPLSKKKGKKNAKPKKYESFGAVLGVDTTFVQAALLLDKVSLGAYETNNTELMMQVATQWLQLGALMHAAFGEEDEKEESPGDSEDSGAAILGFGNTEAREKAEAINRERKSRG
jgi:hypothetical protein